MKSSLPALQAASQTFQKRIPAATRLYIAELENELRAAEQKLSAAPNQKPTGISVGYDHQQAGPRGYIDDNEHVAFHVKTAGFTDAIRIYLRDDHIEVSGDGPITLAPRAANYVDIYRRI